MIVLIAGSVSFAVFTYSLFLLLNGRFTRGAALYVIAAAVVTFATMLTIRETAARPLRKLVAA